MGLAIIPAGLVVFRAALYVVACLHTIAAPGLPVEFEIETPSGALKLKAKSYTVDPSQSLIHVTGVEIVSPSGEQLGTCDFATAKYALNGTELRRVRVVAELISANLRRNSDGRLDLQKYLPTTKSTGEPVAFDIDVRHVVARIEDHSTATVVRRHFDFDGVKIVGTGDEWIAKSRVQAEQIGNVQFRLVHSLDKSLVAEVDFGGKQLANLFSQYRDAKGMPPVLREISIQSLSVAAPLTAVVNKQGKFSFQGQLTASARGLKYREYSADEIDLRGTVSEIGFDGEYRVRVDQTTVSGTGHARFGPKLKLVASTVGQTIDKDHLPKLVTKWIPSKVNFRRANFDGILQFNGDEPTWQGAFSADQISYDQDVASNVRVHLTASPKKIAGSIEKANAQGHEISGVGSVNLASHQIEATVNISKGPVASIFRRFGNSDFSGQVAASVHLTHDVSAPKLEFSATGNLVWKSPTKGPIDLGQIVAVGDFDHGFLTLRQAYSKGPNGLITAEGKVDDRKRLNFEVVARAVPASLIEPGLAGNAFLKLKLKGTTAEPLATGRLETYGVKYQTWALPIVKADIVANRHQVTLVGLKAVSGSGSFGGTASYTFDSRAVSGQLSATRIRLADFIPGDTVGSIDVPSLTIGGTLDHVIASGQLTSASAVVQGLRAEKLVANLQLDGTDAKISSATLQFAGGKVVANGSYDTLHRIGHFTAKATDVDLGLLAPEITNEVSVEGSASADLDLDIHGSELQKANLSASVRNVKFNSVLIGNGYGDVSTDGSIVWGSAEIGQINRYIKAANVHYDLETHGLGGEISALDLRLENIVQATQRYQEFLSPSAREVISQIQAGVNIEGSIQRYGDNGSIGLDMKLIESPAVLFRGHNVGALKAAGSRLGKSWIVKSFVVDGGLGRLTLSGTAQEDGKVNLDGELDKLHLEKLQEFDAALAALSGTIDQVTFSATGDIKSPDISASASASGLLAKAGGDADASLRLSLDEIKISHDQGVSVDGRYFYRGFTGNISGSSPIAFPFEVDQTTPITASLTLVPRDFAEVASLLPGLDPKRTSGLISGNIALSGSLQSPVIAGSVRLAEGLINDKKRPAAIGFSGVEDSLKNVDASLVMGPNGMNLVTKASLSQGGTTTATVGMTAETTKAALKSLFAGEFESLLQLPIAGSVTLKGASVRQVIQKDNVTATELAAGKRLYVTSSGSVSASMSGDISIGGTVQAPAIKGELGVMNSTIVIPTLQPSTASGGPVTFDPTFDVTLSLSGTNRVRTSTAELNLGGDGSLRGSAAKPIAHADLFVVQGTFKLPGGAVRLEPGGTVVFNYDGTAHDPVAQLTVDLDGHSAFTMARSQDQIERYDISISIRGDALRDDSLRLTATSDPPDLSQDEILRYLGRTDILTSLSSGSTRADAERKIKDALTGFALPSVFDSFSKQIAAAIGLEYFSLEYNSYDQASLAFGKILAPGLSFQGSRQLSVPPPGFAQRYDVRLVYRPRWKSRKYDRFRISLGADELRPWKIALEYSFRF